MGKALQWLEKVAQHHNEWVRVVEGFGEFNYQEDIVQEAYIVLSKYANEEKVIKKGVVSRGYLYFTLRSTYLMYLKSKKRIQKVSLDDQEKYVQISDHTEMAEQIAFHKLCTMIDDITEGWHWYDRKLFKLYRDTELSIRKLAKETNISWISIYNTLKNAKQEIKDRLEEDFEDYKNEDYERI